MSKKFTPNVPDASHPFQNVSFVKGDSGDPAQFCMPSISAIAIPVDSDGNNGVFTNAISYLRIIEAGKVIAHESSVGGWGISAISITGGIAIGAGTLTFILTTITADTGYADITISKAGESDLFVRIHFFKIKAGATGPAGATGATGAQGIQGPQGDAGNDGDGIVIIKKTIEIKDAERAVAITEGAGAKVSCQTAAAHDVVQGEKIRITSMSFLGGGGYRDGVVTTIIDANNFLTDIDFVANDAAASFFSFWHFRTGANNNYQSVHFEDLVPARYKILSLNFYVVNWDNGGIYLSCGDAAYPNSVWSKYLSNLYVINLGKQTRVDVSNGFFELDMSPDPTSFYLNAVPFPTDFVDWDTMTVCEIDFMIVCEKLD